MYLLANSFFPENPSSKLGCVLNLRAPYIRSYAVRANVLMVTVLKYIYIYL